MKRAWSIVLLVALMVAVVLPAGVAVGQSSSPVYKQGVVRSNSGEVAVRAEKNISSETLGTLANGTVVDVVAVEGRWALIRTEEVEGYVFTSNLTISLKLLNLSATVAVSAATQLAIRAEKNISSDVVDTVDGGSTVGVLYIDGVWAYVYTSKGLGWTFARDLVLAQDGADAAAFLTDQAVADTRNDLAVRVEPSINSDLAFTVKPGDPVAVLFQSENGLFSYVLVGAQGGWALSSDLAVTSTRVAGNGTINQGRVNFRSEASSDSNDSILGQFALGAEVQLLGQSEDGSWLQVRYEGQDGWVSTQFVDSDSDLSSLPVVD